MAFLFTSSMILFYLLLSIVAIDGQCNKDDCVHGQCIAGKCVCHPGIKGSRCNTDIVDCERDSCLNNGTCIELINGFICECPTGFVGSRCQHRSCPSCKESRSPLKSCSILKSRLDNQETNCVAVGLTPSLDIDCRCEYEKDDKRWVSCEITPSAYSQEKCLYRKATQLISVAKFSSLPDPLLIFVCPVDWQILHRYEKQQLSIPSVHIEKCHLMKN